MRKVFGIGVNDSKDAIHLTKMVNGRKVNLWTCPFYMTWANMLKRCYSKSFHEAQPTYADCAVAEEWHYLSAFREWMNEQPWKGMALDKDILIQGNKVYSKDSCVFISKSLNQFTVDRGACRGEWPTGVTWREDKGRFRAGCFNPFALKVEHLGYFDSPNAAHEAWRKRKHQHALRYADMQDDPRVADALRVRYLNYQDSAGRY